jgi:hypothetical protein
MTTKYFGDDYIMYLMDDKPRTIQEAYFSLDDGLWKEIMQSLHIQLCLMELGKSLSSYAINL